MNKITNKCKIGNPILGWKERSYPSIKSINGKYCRLERVDENKHFYDLYKVYGPSSNLANWTYLPFDNFRNKNTFRKYLKSISHSEDPAHFAIIDQENGRALGTLALMRIDSKQGVMEVGYVIYSDELKKTRIATEAQFLMAEYVFNDLKYRRYEWKCDSLNLPSIKSALRLGFSFEGVFRQAMIYKGRNRDTAWFSIIDKEWNSKKDKFIKWLSEENFDEAGNQIFSLSKF